MRRRVVTAAVLTAALLAAAVPAASARGLNFRNARYCEVLGVKSVLPGAVATVWNTIGLNRCPEMKWRRLSADALAAQLGDIAVVLNGPRYFLMDSASGTIGHVRSFDSLRMRKVATIRIATLAGLARAPYENRTIGRTNTWVWNPDRQVFVLTSPTGARYVMQSYAQIVDPHLTLRQLPSLGHRLRLPAGWSYAVRTVHHRFALGAHGSAIIIQDELQDTYQLVPAHQRL